MKTLVVYSSQTGNTKKLAEAVFQILPEEKTLCHISQAPNPDGFDLVVLGFWLQAGKPDPKSSEYLAKLSDQHLFLLATHGAAADSEHAKEAMDIARSIPSAARVIGQFNCPGEVNPAHLEKARRKDPQPVWVKDAHKAVGHPDGGDIEGLTAAVQACIPNIAV
jgi:hypothetical protein